MAGRKPKPTALKLVTGNPGKRPLNDHEPQPEAAIPEVPVHLSNTAKAEWDRIVIRLHPLGLVTDLDRAALAAYCESWATWVEAVEKVRETGRIIKAPSGYPVLNPYVTIANKALDQMHRFLTEFGMTPASRSRISIAIHEDDDRDPAERYFGRG